MDNNISLYAKFSNAVYYTDGYNVNNPNDSHNNSLAAVNGWKIIYVSPPDSNGFQAAAYAKNFDAETGLYGDIVGRMGFSPSTR